MSNTSILDMSPKEESVLIVGAGCYGLATAHQLALDGYTKISVFDKDDVVPSRFSAANDLNKVIRAEYSDPFYTDLALKAIEKWRTDPLFSPHYHETGFLNVASKAATRETKQVIGDYFRSIESHPAWRGQVEQVNGAAAVRKLVPAFQGPVDGWTGYYNKLAGYGHSANTLRAVYEECVKLGVTFHLGRGHGDVEALLHTSATRGVRSMRCVGVKTSRGKIHFGDKIIIAVGSGVANLIPSIAGRVSGRCWGVAHLQLTPKEAESLQGIPVTNVRDLAFFFEPDSETKKLKFCHMGGGFTNYAATNDGYSVPFDQVEDSQFIPQNDEAIIRRLLQEVLPQLADRPLIDQHLCWMADADDSDYVIDYVPGTDSSLIVLSGDSGHGFKMMPIFGSFVKNLLQKGSQAEPKWRWKRGPRAKASNWRASESAELANLPRAKL